MEDKEKETIHPQQLREENRSLCSIHSVQRRAPACSLASSGSHALNLQLGRSGGGGLLGGGLQSTSKA